jgi:hypothetical protein
MKPLKTALRFWPVLLLGAAPALADSATEYSWGNYVKVPAEVKKEMAAGFHDSQEFIATVRLATNSFVQDRSINLQELLSVYDSAAAQAKKFHYDERIVAEKAEVSDWLGREQKVSASEATSALESTLKWPEVSVPDLTKKSSRLFALALLARRNLLAEKADPEWYFVAGKTLDADTGSGDAFLELYLEQPSLAQLPHREDAVAMIEKVYQRRYDGEIPAKLKSRLKHWKSAVPVPAPRNSSKR